MSDDSIAALHASRWYGCFAITGGGSRTLARLLEVPGASATVAEAVIPYAEKALHTYLNGKPDRAADESTARLLAMAAYQRALAFPLPHPDSQRFGFGLTASLRSNRPKRGAHRIHAAVQTRGQTLSCSLTLTKDLRTRHEEELIATEFALHALFCGLGLTYASPDLAMREEIVQRVTTAPDDLQQLLAGEREALAQPPDAPDRSDRRLLFPGSFNPMHEGHRAMAALAETHLGTRCEYEVCVRNADKPPLDYISIQHRIEQLPKDRRRWLTRAPTYRDKAKLFRNTTFIIGIDTLTRIADPRFYGESEQAMQQAIGDLATNGARFLVFGRRVGDSFQGLRDFALPANLIALCESVSEEAFRADVSSSELRAHQGADADD